MNNEFFDNPDEKLEDALAMLAAGMPLEEILAEADGDAEWLRPLLALAAEVGDLQQAIPIPSPEASLQKLLAYGEELAGVPQSTTPAQSDGHTSLSKLLKSWWSRLFMGGDCNPIDWGIIRLPYQKQYC